MEGVAALEALVERARGGDGAALEELVAAIQDRVYRLALRMLSDPADAQDATQEILIKVITNLVGFRGDSAFATWVYRVASNHLLTARKRRAEQMGLRFDGLGALLEQGLAYAALQEPPEAEDRLLEEEVKRSCTLAMLQCLDRDQRLAFILGEILGMTSVEGAYVTETTPEVFRKRLSRARARLREFMGQRCGLVNPESPCRCARQVPFALHAGLVDREHPRLATHPVRRDEDEGGQERVRELERLERATAVFRSHPRYAAPEAFAARMKELIASGAFRVASE